MNLRTSDFPFTIEDIAALLRLNIRRRSPAYTYADCPICGDRRGKLCISLEKNTWFSNCCGHSGGMLALYGTVHGLSNSEAYREIRDALVNDFPAERPAVQNAADQQEPPVPQAGRAAPQEIHRTYAALLSMLTLNPAHRRHLTEVRGLTDEQIAAFGFKSTPPPYICRTLTEQLVRSGYVVEGVPGFYVNKSGRWMVKFHQRTAGILIPFRGMDGLICGFQIRLDRPIRNEDDPPDKPGAKYLPLSSAKKPMGTSSGNMLHFVGDPFARVVYVTEGALKADICHALTNRTFAATVGANNTALLGELFSQLRKNGTEEIIEAEDMDKYRNEAVSKGASKVYLLAKEYGLQCRRLTWNPNYKGLDDWLLSLRLKKEQSKEMKTTNFKQSYLFGRCPVEAISDFESSWRNAGECRGSLQEYLGLTEAEYEAFRRRGTGGLQELLEAQRRSLRFRIYQLPLEYGGTKPFAFAAIDKLYEAGYQQPPAADYLQVLDEAYTCPAEMTDDAVLETICRRFTGDLPEGYGGRSIAASDVLELSNSDGRRYFYRNPDGFIPVRFSPMLSQRKAGMDERSE